MGMARSICRMPLILVIVILALCVGLSTWGLMSSASKAIKSFVDEAAAKYDVLFPEITVKNGLASIREQQPYHIDLFGDNEAKKEVVLVVDTREGKENEAMDYLKETQSGAVLTRKTLIFKNRHQIRVIPLKDMPDTVVNSATIRELSSKYVPTLIQWAVITVLVYFFLAKPAQALLLAMIPYFAARAYEVDTTYGQSLKIAIVAMPVPVILDLLANLLHLRISAAFVLYFVIYLGVILLITRDLTAASLSTPDSEEQISLS